MEHNGTDQWCICMDNYTYGKSCFNFFCLQTIHTFPITVTHTHVYHVISQNIIMTMVYPCL